MRISDWSSDVCSSDLLGFLGDFGAPQIAAVGDAKLKRAKPLRAPVFISEDHLERPEAERGPQAPDDIAKPSEHALQPVRDGRSDQRGKADRRHIGEIVIVDCAEIDPRPAAVGDDIDRARKIQRNAERAGEAVRRAERQKRKDAVLVDEAVDGARNRTIAAAHDRSEEHTSEPQSLMRISYAVFCLKKKTTT